jgi:hypothetical protein
LRLVVLLLVQEEGVMDLGEVVAVEVVVLASVLGMKLQMSLAIVQEKAGYLGMEVTGAWMRSLTHLHLLWRWNMVVRVFKHVSLIITYLGTR